MELTRSSRQKLTKDPLQQNKGRIMNRNKKKEIESEIIKRLVAEFVMSGGKITQVADGVISAPMFPSHNNQFFKTNKVDDDGRI